MCVYPIESFGLDTFFYRRYPTSLLNTSTKKPLYSAFIDLQKQASFQWCLKSGCFCCKQRCVTEKLYVKETAYKAVLDVNGKPPRPEMPVSVLQEKYPKVNLEDIKKFWKVSERKQVVFLNSFKIEDYQAQQASLSVITRRAIEYLQEADRAWHVAAIQGTSFAKAGVSHLLQRDISTGHVEWDQRQLTDEKILDIAISLSQSCYVIR